MPELFPCDATSRSATPLTRLAPHPHAITETTCSRTWPVEIGRKPPVGVVSVIAAVADKRNHCVNVERLAEPARRLAYQDSNAW
jgi:hypothetical protein